MDRERRMFGQMTEEENQKAVEVGKSIWNVVVDQSVVANDPDIIFNGITSVLVSFAIATVHKEDYAYFIQLVHKVLLNNLMETTYVDSTGRPELPKSS